MTRQAIASLVLLSALVAGCCTVPFAAVEQLESHWGLIGPVARRAIQNDPDLDDQSKVTRLRSIARFEELIVELKNHAAR